MKRICYIATVPITIESFVLKSIEYLHATTDWDFSIICSPDSDIAFSLPNYVHFYPVKMHRGIDFRDIRSAIQMRRIFSNQAFDLIQYSTPNASLYAAIAGKIAHVPVRLYCQWGMAYVGMTGVKRTCFKLVEKTVCSLSTWVEPDSPSNLRFAQAEKLFSSNSSSVVWNGSACGVDLDKFDYLRGRDLRKAFRNELNIPDDARVFCFVGRITRDKGINELLEAFKSLLEENEHVYLLLIGSKDGMKGIDPQIYDWSKSQSNVIYCGYTNNVEHYLAASDIYVLPSYREGFGMSVIEAEAMGLPVIVTRIPGPIDAMIEGETGFVAEPKDIDSLLNTMRAALAVDAGEMGMRGHDYVARTFDQRRLFEYIRNDRMRLLGEGVEDR